MNKVLLYAIIFLTGVIISAFAQVLLKKSANEKKDNIIKEYFNIKTIGSYIIFFIATLCTVIAYKYLPLSYGPILGTLEYIMVAILSFLILKEKISRKKLIGFIIVLFGVFIYSL